MALRRSVPSTAATDLARAAIYALVTVAILATARPVHAQVAEAEALFDDATKALAAGKVAEACDMFEASNRLEPRAGTLINLGECRTKQGRLASAWSAYRDSESRAKDPRKLQIAKDAGTALEARLSYMTVSVPDESRVEGLVITRNGKDLDPGLWNRAIPVDGGDYVIAGRAPGHEEWSTKAKVPNELGKVTVDVPKFKALAALIKPTLGPAQPTTPDEPSMFTTRRKIALGLAGGAVVAIAAGAVLGTSAKGLQDDAHATCPDPDFCTEADTANDEISRGHTRAVFANVAFGVGGAAAVGAVVLWLVGKPQPTEHANRTAATFQITPGFSGVTVLGRF